MSDEGETCTCGVARKNLRNLSHGIYIHYANAPKNPVFFLQLYVCVPLQGKVYVACGRS